MIEPNIVVLLEKYAQKTKSDNFVIFDLNLSKLQLIYAFFTFKVYVLSTNWVKNSQKFD